MEQRARMNGLDTDTGKSYGRFSARKNVGNIKKKRLMTTVKEVKKRFG